MGSECAQACSSTDKCQGFDFDEGHAHQCRLFGQNQPRFGAQFGDRVWCVRKEEEKVHPCDTEEKGGCAQMCEKEGDNVKCGCAEGFVLGGDGKSCEKEENVPEGDFECHQAHVGK